MKFCLKHEYQKTFKKSYAWRTQARMAHASRLGQFDEPITGESWKYPEVKTKNSEFSVPGHVILVDAIYI